MKEIPIGSNSFLHLYLIEKTHPDEIDNLRESYSREVEEEQQKEPYIDKYKIGAENFFEAMKGHYCIRFLEALADKIADEIIEEWSIFAPQRLKEDRYKRFISFRDWEK